MNTTSTSESSGEGSGAALKPCPFCGKAPDALVNEVAEEPHWLGCMDMKCAAPYVTGDSEAACIAQWNRRALPDSAAAPSARAVSCYDALLNLADAFHEGNAGPTRPEAEGYVTSLVEAAEEALDAAPSESPSAKSLGAKYDDTLLPFVALMRRELHANAGKGDRPGWLTMDRKTAILEVHHHIAKLQKATLNNDAEGIREFAADVANMAMMVVDVCGVLTENTETT
jgi:Lar family restriction alleviation protein